MSLYRKIRREFEPRPGGVYLPRGLLAKTFDGHRAWRVMWKIVRGLFFHHYDRYLPHNTPQDFGVYGRPQDVDGKFRDMLDLSLPVNGAVQECFAYRFVHVDEPEMNLHYWDMLFWQSVLCVLLFHDPDCQCDICGAARQKHQEEHV